MRQNTAILDVGSSKIVCLICSGEANDGITVRGAGVKEYDGFKNARFVDEQQFSNAVVDAIAMAESEARYRIRELSVGVPASFSRLVLHEGHAKVDEKNHRISQRTIDELIDSSFDFEPPEGFDLMHSTPIEFAFGDTVCADAPIGKLADDLGATVSHVYMSGAFKRSMAAALDRTNLAADMFISVPLSQALFVIPEPERTDCAVLIDTGCRQTDVSLIRGSAIIACETIPIGGYHFASDISYGLGIPMPTAEGVKRRYVYSLDYQDSIDIIKAEGAPPMQVEHSVIQLIIEERTKELTAYIVAAMREMGVTISERLPIYMTGGGVPLMRGSCEFMEKYIGAPIKVRMPWMPRLSSTNYASAFSVMDFVVHADDDNNAWRLVGNAVRSGLMEKLRVLIGGGR